VVQVPPYFVLVLVLVLGHRENAAHADPRIAAFTCAIGDNRTRILPRAREEDADDEMHCRASVRSLGGRSAADLVAEVSLLPPAAPARVAASDRLTPAAADTGELGSLILPAATWLSAVDWRARPPRLRLVLRIYDKPPPGQKRWRLVASRQLDFGGRRLK
jgi:hypothetical protein